MTYNNMNATVKGHDCRGNEFEDKLSFELIEPKKGERYYGTGCYMAIKLNGAVSSEDVRYARTTDIEILADRWIAGFYGKNAEEVSKEFPSA